MTRDPVTDRPAQNFRYIRPRETSGDENSADLHTTLRNLARDTGSRQHPTGRFSRRTLERVSVHKERSGLMECTRSSGSGTRSLFVN